MTVLGPGDDVFVYQRNIVAGQTQGDVTIEDFGSTYFSVELDGAQSVPANATSASGMGTGVLNRAGTRFEIDFTLSGIDVDGMQTIDPGDDLTVLHIHRAPPGSNGPVVFGFVGPNSDTNGDLVIEPAMGRVFSGWDQNEGNNTTLTAELQALRDSDLYVNVHTADFPSGEIRGQIFRDDNGNDRIDVSSLNVGSFSTLIGLFEDVNGSATLVTNRNGATSTLVLEGVPIAQLQASDFIFGGAGDQRLNGSNRDDDLFGGDGNDNIGSGIGDDRLFGENGNDVFRVGFSGNQLYDGGEGIDTVSYLFGANVDVNLTTGIGGRTDGNPLYVNTLVSIENVSGSNGADRIVGDAGRNVLSGGRGDDRLFGEDGDDLLRGGRENDTMFGGSGADRLEGGLGDDLLIGGGSASGTDVLLGEEGNDRFFAGFAGSTSYDGGDGIDTIFYNRTGSAIDVSLFAGSGSAGSASDSYVGIENVSGTARADRIIGDNGDNALFGRDGDDTLYGRAGNDLLVGGRGADTLVGGPGSDIASYVGAASGVTLDLRAGTGTRGDADGDTFSGIVGAIGTDHADQIFGFAGVNVLSGGAGNDFIAAREGNDTLQGGDGNDRLNGGLGNDRHTGGEGLDTFVLVANHGRDVVTDFEQNFDQLDYRFNAAVSQFSDLTIRSVGSNAVIEDGAGGVLIVLDGAGLMDERDFLF